ncbi:hypothetical protein [Marinobacter sp.]|uniref:hypothetical protein n=1 Tax=Marinobacter sp. TaxID=50741 RepID=UPI003F9A0A86
MTKPDPYAWVIECADYIRDKQARDNFTEGRELSSGQVQNKRDELKEKLETAIKKADAAVEALAPLHRELQLGLDQFGTMATRISEAWNSALQVQTECRLALSETLPNPRTREMDLHQAAARLAVAYDSGPGARSMALNIMVEAGLNEPGQATLTRWLKEAREN